MLEILRRARIRATRRPLDPIQDTALSRFRRWSGTAPAGYDVNWLGQLTDVRFVAGWADEHRMQPRHYDPVPYPTPGEEIFEWWHMLDAVLDARERFVMVELGAGFGRWLVAAALALQQAHPSLPYLLIGIEGDADHYRCLLQHFRDNGIDPAEHRLVHAAIADRDGTANFAVSDNTTGWWGQQIVASEAEIRGTPNSRIEPVKAYSVRSIIGEFGRIDHMDFDIQGAEEAVIPAAISIMTEKVKRAFVETHSDAAHSSVAAVFRSRGWKAAHLYGMKGAVTSDDETQFGRITFQGGLQCWVNPRIY